MCLQKSSLAKKCLKIILKILKKGSKYNFLPDMKYFSSNIKMSRIALNKFVVLYWYSSYFEI